MCVHAHAATTNHIRHNNIIVKDTWAARLDTYLWERPKSSSEANIKTNFIYQARDAHPRSKHTADIALAHNSVPR